MTARESDYLVYIHASCIAEQYFVAWHLWWFLSYILDLCEDVVELQDDIAHSEAQDSLMCSAGRIPFACYQQMIL